MGGSPNDARIKTVLVKLNLSLKNLCMSIKLKSLESSSSAESHTETQIKWHSLGNDHMTRKSLLNLRQLA